MGNEVETRATKAPAVIKRAGQSLKIQRLTPAIGAEVGNINIGDAARDPELMASLRAAEITLEICPTSNLLTKALADEDAVREVFRAFVEHGVQFTIATDGPEMMRTHLRDEFELLLRIGALDDAELQAANERGHEAAFVGRHAHARA